MYKIEDFEIWAKNNVKEYDRGLEGILLAYKGLPKDFNKDVERILSGDKCSVYSSLFKKWKEELDNRERERERERERDKKLVCIIIKEILKGD